MATCQATRRDGQPCRTHIVGDSTYCFGHDPAMREKRLAASRKGGQNKSRANRLQRLVPASLKPTIAALILALEEVHSGTLEPKQGQAMAALAGAIARLYSVGVLEERIAVLEAAQVNETRRQTAW
jgi:hypothetical protein